MFINLHAVRQYTISSYSPYCTVVVLTILIGCWDEIWPIAKRVVNERKYVGLFNNGGKYELLAFCGVNFYSIRGIWLKFGAMSPLILFLLTVYCGKSFSQSKFHCNSYLYEGIDGFSSCSMQIFRNADSLCLDQVQFKHWSIYQIISTWMGFRQREHPILALSQGLLIY